MSKTPKRKFPRFESDLDANIETDDERTLPVKVKNISEGGMFAQMPGTMPNLDSVVDDMITIELQLPDFPHLVRCPGYVVWTDERGLGIELADMGPQANELLVNLMAHLSPLPEKPD